MRLSIKLLIFICCLVFILSSQNLRTLYEITYNYVGIYREETGSWKYENGENSSKFIAWANYTTAMELQGWDFLAITTNKIYEDEVQAEAAGRLEGYLTKERIYNHYLNLLEKAKWQSGMPENVQHFFNHQEDFVNEMFKLDKEDSNIYNANLIVKQFNGLRSSYNEYSEENKKIENVAFHVISSFGDLFDIVSFHDKPEYEKWDSDQILAFIRRNSHCSALFKVADDYSDIFFGHNSWFFYSAMNRIFKEYNFNFNHPSIKAKNIVFSSYPGILASMDDFYVTSRDLAVIETTNPFFNNDLYEKLTPKSLLCWQRAMIANRMSVNAKEWTENFSKYNSGTYNNQFMALDMKKVDLPNNSIDNEAMFIVEQVPGEVAITDVTEHLAKGYWPSYNSPYSKRIREISGIDELLKKRPELKHTIDYNTCSRANIFRRDNHKAGTYESFKKMIRYNNYKNDPFSLDDAANSISSREDLNGNHCQGAYDAKMSSVSKAKGRFKTISIAGGPTHDDLEGFNWSKSNPCRNQPRHGLPDNASFEWVDYHTQFTDYEQKDTLKYIQ